MQPRVRSFCLLARGARCTLCARDATCGDGCSALAHGALPNELGVENPHAGFDSASRGAPARGCIGLCRLRKPVCVYE